MPTSILTPIQFQMAASTATKFNYTKLAAQARACYEADTGKTISNYDFGRSVMKWQAQALHLLYKVMYNDDSPSPFQNASYRQQECSCHLYEGEDKSVFCFGNFVAEYEGGRLMLYHKSDMSSCEWERNLIPIEYWKKQEERGRTEGEGCKEAEKMTCDESKFFEEKMNEDSKGVEG